MENRFFSLIIVPDSGNEVTTGSFNIKLVLSVFAALILTFLVCLFFIIGYHIKLTQEKDYKNVRLSMNDMLEYIDTSKNQLAALSEHLYNIQRNDVAYRKFAYMDVLDAGMYQAGVGGHVIVDDQAFIGLKNDVRRNLEDISLELVSLENRIKIQELSFKDIYVQVLENNDEYNNTPSILPTHSYRITSSFAYRTHPITKVREFHDAVDLAGKIGNDIYATADGVVEKTSRGRFLGNHVVIRHKYGYKTTYGHLLKFYVKPGDTVKKGDVIGAMGNTGRITGVHLHYKITQFGKAQNPVKYF